MNKIEEIFKSFRISFNPNDAQADLAAKRIQICDTCEFKSITEIGPVLVIARCSVCGCVLKGKIFTPLTYKTGGSCPKQKWIEIEDEWLGQKTQ